MSYEVSRTFSLIIGEAGRDWLHGLLVHCSICNMGHPASCLYFADVPVDGETGETVQVWSAERWPVLVWILQQRRLDKKHESSKKSPPIDNGSL